MKIKTAMMAILAVASTPAFASGIGVSPAGPAPFSAPYMETADQDRAVGKERRDPSDHARSPDHGRPGGFGGPGGPGGPGRGMPSADHMFDMMDANHDGSLSRAEFSDARRRMMQRRPGGPDGRAPGMEGHPAAKR